MEKMVLITPQDLQAVLTDVVNSCLKHHKHSPVLNSVPDELLTTAEAAAFLKISRQTLSTWKTEGKIPFVRVGSLVRFRKSDLLGLNKSKSKAA